MMSATNAATTRRHIITGAAIQALLGSEMINKLHYKLITGSRRSFLTTPRRHLFYLKKPIISA